MPTRRQFITGLSAIAGFTAAGTTAAEQFSEQPDDVTITGYDDVPDDIERYQPFLDMSRLEIKASTQYAWRAKRPEWEQDWYLYVTHYVGQRGYSSEDSHLPDREIIAVGVEDGAVTRTLYTEWHYAIVDDDDPELHQETHPSFRIQAPHHGHIKADVFGEFVPLDDLKQKYPDFLTDGWSVSRKKLIRPPLAAEKGNYWPEDMEGDHRLAVFWHNNFSGLLGFNPFRLDDWS